MSGLDSPQGKKRTGSRIAQQETEPRENAKDDWKKERLARMHVRRHCATEIGCHENRAERGRLRDGVDETTQDFCNQNWLGRACRVAVLHHSLDDFVGREEEEE